MNNDVSKAKEMLDLLISKQRAHMYKVVQVAEVLYQTRMGTLTQEQIRDNLSSYRNLSKSWRDEVSQLLVGRASTSSQKYQDNLFDSNAIPPQILFELAQANIDGIVERYIYQRFREKQKQIFDLNTYLNEKSIHSFYLSEFLAQFTGSKGLKRSIDKAFEIVVYALFNSLVKHLRATVTVSVDISQKELLAEFDDFAQVLLGVNSQNPSFSTSATLYRAGVTNAADRGLDIWANFGPAVQVKHLTLTEELAEEIVDQIPSNQIVIVCRDSEKEIIERITNQLNFRLQGIITESQLIKWYERALRGNFQAQLGTDLLKSLRTEFQNEFPFSHSFEGFYRNRRYHQINQPDSLFWVRELI